uniref:SanA/YdcF family protein n=1 Tax=Candidatus Roseilinea sp. NK_OTU-006 TaxID=2704250 RepID=UPI002A5AC847|nr:ElyC/SanA/YdcF family protein [Candidatus Roseilinea sp. NK_OTU-006]
MIKRVILLTAILVVIVPLLARGFTMAFARSRIYTAPEATPHHRVAIVFGAGVRGNQPSAVLYDRVVSAVALYRAGVVDKLLMSGDKRFANYNEPAVMRQTALRLGVLDDDIALDYAGHSTYDTCFRARTIFGLRDAVLVTQAYHLDRAIFTCSALGVAAVGYPADRRPYAAMSWFQLREFGATLKAFWDLFISRPLPALGEPLPNRLSRGGLLHFPLS